MDILYKINLYSVDVLPPQGEHLVPRRAGVRAGRVLRGRQWCSRLNGGHGRPPWQPGGGHGDLRDHRQAGHPAAHGRPRPGATPLQGRRRLRFQEKERIKKYIPKAKKRRK